ncbi:MAG: hypothetical protein ACYDDE_02620 [bacterium]
MHSFYSGIEKIFKIIAKEIDGSSPEKQYLIKTPI